MLALGAALPHSARADEEEEAPKLEFSPSFKRFSAAQYALTLGLGAGLFGTTMLSPNTQPRWEGGVLLDSPVRNLLAAGSERGRDTASRVSDVLALGLVLYPFVIDGLLVAGAVHKNADVAFQMSMINVQAVLITSLVTNLTKHLFARARPDSANCKEGDKACTESTDSFLSGHTSGAFVGAGLICAHHQNLPLYGDGPAGTVACGAALGAATAVGTLRIVADRHHLTDVLAGAALGLTAGWLLPNILNYDFGATRALSRAGARIYPIISPKTIGIGYVQTW